MASKSKSKPSGYSTSRLYMSMSCLTSNDYSIFRAEIFNSMICGTTLFFIYLLFDNKPYLFTNTSNDLWKNIISYWPYEIKILYLLLNLVFSSIPFITVCSFYDIIYKYKLFRSYRINNNKYPDQKLVSNTFWYDLRLLLLYVPLGSYFTFNANNNFDPIPNLWIICSQFFGAIYTFDILFHISHRMLHFPPLYKYHKLHHEYKVTISWAATYSEMFELLFSSVPATALPIIIWKLHPITTLLYFMYRNVETAVAHSGYDLPFYISPLGILKHLPGHYAQERLHDFHHSHNDGCYGFYFTDAMFGTNASFRKYFFSKKKLKFRH